MWPSLTSFIKAKNVLTGKQLNVNCYHKISVLLSTRIVLQPRSYYHEANFTFPLFLDVISRRLVKEVFVSLNSKYTVVEFFYFYFFIIFSRFYLFTFKGREKESERNINVWLPLMQPALGTWPTTQACALTGNQTGNPLVRSSRSIHWATPVRASCWVFKCVMLGLITQLFGQMFYIRLLLYVDFIKPLPFYSHFSPLDEDAYDFRECCWNWKLLFFVTQRKKSFSKMQISVLLLFFFT